MKVLKIKNQNRSIFLNFKCPIRNINGVHYLKVPLEFYNSYKEILKKDKSYINLMPISIGNNEVNLNLTIPKSSVLKEINDIVSYVGEIIK